MKSYDEMTESVLKRRDDYFREKKIRVRKAKRVAATLICAALVCLCVGLTFWEKKSNEPVVNSTMENFYGGAEVTSETEKMVTVNEVDAGDFFLMGVYSPNSYDVTVLDEKEAAEHLGKTLDFSFLPDYLIASESNSQQEIHRDKNTGKIIDGGITFTYLNEDKEDEVSVYGGVGGKRISFTVCREDEAMPDRYKWPENAKASYIDTFKVYIGKAEMEAVSEYDFETGEAEYIKYYVYAAEFRNGGLRYVISATDFTDDEFIEILTDFINANNN